ncbi:hypothetical protein STAS_08027 [Striga asiatica]|uniref:Uncharacterized protein n=1 Tax=Striga asiatica TaxID=4170 RepID=A0A5A7PGG8_STRAF|nr:hypothetical protein STAS_08027 [Striga asiatica]
MSSTSVTTDTGNCVGDDSNDWSFVVEADNSNWSELFRVWQNGCVWWRCGGAFMNLGGRRRSTVEELTDQLAVAGDGACSQYVAARMPVGDNGGDQRSMVEELRG